MAQSIRPLLLEARHTLVWHQGDLANLWRVSRRTVQRWDAGRGSPDPAQVVALARVVYPKNAELASRLARAVGTSLEALGLVVAPAASPPKPAPPPPPPFVPLNAHMVDSITCAAADAMNMVPGAVRPALRAAFERARDLRLSAADVATALASPQGTSVVGGARGAARGT
jgi:DNA-binding XRE family transcriptional regulator